MMNFLTYIDPGTGSMLFTIIIGVVTTCIFLVRGLIIKLKFGIHNNKDKSQSSGKIPFVIFSDSKRYWNVFKPICDEFEKRGKDIVYMTASPDDPALEESYEHVKCEFIGEGNKAFVKLNMLSATICLSTTPGLDVLQWKRSKDVDYYVHTFHAVDDGIGYRMFALDFYDAVLLNGSIQEGKLRKLEELRGLKPKEIESVGVVQLDTMKKRFDEMNKNVSSDDKKPLTVLCAPSWGDSSILNKYGEVFLQHLIDTGYKIIVRPHPQSKTSDPELLEKLQNMFPNNELFEWNYDNDNFNVLNEADIMISDFSGVIFDYTFIFDKPVIYADTEFDKSPYDAAWFEEPMFVLEVLPTLGPMLKEEDFSNMKSLIDETIHSEKYKEGRANARDNAWAHKGEAAERTVDFLLNKYEELTNSDREA